MPESPLVVIDSRQMTDGATVGGDVCIVGAGAAGITIARALRDSGLDVVLLESGGLEADAETQALAEGEVVGAPLIHSGVEQPLVATRLRWLGGTTNHWSGYCRPLDPMDFDEREWIPDSGWPFQAEELGPWYDAAHDVCQLGPRRYDWQWWSQRYGLPAPLIDTDEFVTTLYQLSPPTRFGVVYRNDLFDAPRIDTYLWANVVDLVLDQNRLAGVEVRTLTGRRFRVECRATVLAAGAIEVARLLLAARSQRPAGVGNEHDLVGRYFMEHPHLGVQGVLALTPPALRHFDKQEYPLPAGEFAVGETRALATVALTPQAQRQHAIGGFSALLVPFIVRPDEEDELTPFAVSALLRPGDDAPGTSRVLVGIRSEQAPNRDSRVRLGSDEDALGMRRVELEWRPSRLDRDTIERGLGILSDTVGRLGLGRIGFEEDGKALSERDLGTGYHHMGTTRMAADPTRGVVDANCRVHSVEGLYVAGSAVFPTAGFSNPTLTIVALALRLADHLRVVLR